MKVDKNSISGPYKLIFRFRVYIRDKSTEYWMKSRESGNFMDFEKKMKLPGQVYQMLLNGVGFIKKIKK